MNKISKKVLLVVSIIFLSVLSACATKEFTISFETNGGNLISDITLNDSQIISQPEVPVKEGHVFSGWFIDQNLSISYGFDTILNKDTTLYVKWEINQYNVDYFIYEDYHPLDTFGLQASEKIVSVSLGAHFSTALTASGRLLTWGNNLEGQLGDGTNVNRIFPMDITNQFDLEDDEKIIDVSVFGWHVLAMTSNGRLFTWGNNAFGQLGDRTTEGKLIPTEITNQFGLDINDQIVSISSGSSHSAAISSLGRIFTWGRNNVGQLGDGTTKGKLIPTEITHQFDLENNEKIISSSLGEGHSSALTSNGRTFFWGAGSYGQLGDGLTGVRTSPFDITSQFNLESNETMLSVSLDSIQSSVLTSNETIVSVSLGAIHSSVLTSNGRYFIWGNNFKGRLGDGGLDNREVPFDISSMFNLEQGETIAHISLGAFNSSAVTSLNRVFIWGNNEAGQIGNGETVEKNTPVDITNQFDLENNESIISVSFGYWHTSVITSLGRVFIWGNNASGQVGNGTLTMQLTQVELEKLMVHKQENYDYTTTIEAYIPVRDGFTFSGWFIDDTFSQAYMFTTMPAENISLFGYWIPNL